MLAISLHLDDTVEDFNSIQIKSFSKWKDFWKFVNSTNIKKTHTLIFSNITLCTRKEDRTFSPRKNDGFWIVEVKKRNT